MGSASVEFVFLTDLHFDPKETEYLSKIGNCGWNQPKNHALHVQSLSNLRLLFADFAVIGLTALNPSKVNRRISRLIRNRGMLPLSLQMDALV